MPATPVTACQMLDREFLEIRCRLIDIAAALDRIDRRDYREAAEADPRYARIREALGLMASSSAPDRAEQIQMLFSESYDPSPPPAAD